MADKSAKSATYKLVAEKVGCDTIDYLRRERDSGQSWRAISLNLWALRGIDVTEVTLRKWWADANAEASGVPVGVQ